MYTYKAVVVNVVDGDTFDAIVDLGFHLTAKLRFRVLGINAPEMKGATAGAGKAARAKFIDLVLNKEVTIKTEKADSFGRWLAGITMADGEDVGMYMITKGYAETYWPS